MKMNYNYIDNKLYKIYIIIFFDSYLFNKNSVCLNIKASVI